MDKLLPPEWLAAQPQWVLLLICAASLAALIKGADILVEGIAAIAFKLRISKVVVAATVLSLGTTSPETAVSVMAAWAGQPELALGNAVGSVVCNAALIFGLGCALTVLPADRYVLWRQGAWQLGAGVLLTALCLGAYAFEGRAAMLARWVGFLFMALLCVYIVLSVKWGKRHPHGEPFLPPQDIAAPVGIQRRSILALSMISLGGLIIVLIGSRVFVSGIITLSEVHWNIPPVIIAATIVALGTSLPELVISITSVMKRHGEVLVGNVIGANVLNVLWVTGAAAVARPLPLLDPNSKYPAIFLYLHLPAMVLVLVLFSTFVVMGIPTGKFRRWQGWPMLGLYVVYIVIQAAMLG